jgi:hypothetical protein
VNGALLVAAESKASAVTTAWGRVTASATASLALWFVILYLGTWLTVAA